MVECKYCKGNFSTKSSLTRHNKRCKVLKIINQENLTLAAAYKKHKNIQKHIKSSICHLCSKSFSTQASMYRHKRTSCKVAKQNKQEKEDIYQELINLKKEIDELKILHKKKNKKKNIKKDNSVSINGNNNNYNSNNNSNNTIIYNVTACFGNEDMTKIDQSDILKAIKKGFYSTIELAKTIHFNSKYPEYQNIYIPNISQNWAMAYTKDGWELVETSTAMEQLYDNRRDYIENNMEKWIADLDNSRINALKRWLHIDEHNKKHEKLKEIKDKIKLLLYNKKHIPITTRKEGETIS